MKIVCTLAILLLLSCKSGPKKPDNLIEEDVMISIFYDLAVLDAVRSHSPLALHKLGDKPADYIYKKYDIDSVQFAESNKYYAADIGKYKELYDEVASRIESKKSETDTLAKKSSGKLPAPEDVGIQSAGGVVK